MEETTDQEMSVDLSQYPRTASEDMPPEIAEYFRKEKLRLERQDKRVAYIIDQLERHQANSI